MIMADGGRTNYRCVKSFYTEVDGWKIHYQKTGMGPHVILLMPGAIGSTETDFSLQLETMNKELFTIIAWDPPGYGKSRPPARTWPVHFFERDADIAHKLMQTLCYQKYSLMGWSDGGNTALILTAKYPQEVKKLVVWGSQSYVTEEESEMTEISDLANWSENMKQLFVKEYGETYLAQLWKEYNIALKQYFIKRKGNFSDDLLCDIKCPTLIIYGWKDVVVPPFHCVNLHNKIKGSRLMYYTEGKHNLHKKYCKEFNSDVERFLIEKNKL